MHRIKDMLSLFMSEILQKKNVLLLILLMVYMYYLLKSAYADCAGTYGFQSCETEAEGLNWNSVYACGNGGLYHIPWLPESNCYWMTCTPLTPIGDAGCLPFSGVFVCGTICWNYNGPLNMKCSSGDPCCLKPDDPCCQVAGSTGSGSNVPNAVIGH